MIRITMVVNRHEDRWETTFDFNTKNSSEYNCDLMMHFFQACIIDENLGATRVRKEVTDKGGQKYYQLKMDFKSRGQIAKAVALGSLRGRLNYNATFCASANYFFKQVFKRNDIDDFEEVELIEPQKVGIIRSTGARAGLAAIVYFIIKMVCRNVEFEQPLLVNVCALAGAFVAFLLLDMTLGRPGGITAKESDRSFYSRNAEAAETPVKKKRWPGRKKMLAFQISWRVAIVLLIVGIFVWAMWPETVAEYVGLSEMTGEVTEIHIEKYTPDSDERLLAEYTGEEETETLVALLEQTKCRKFLMDDSPAGQQPGYEVTLITSEEEKIIFMVEENKFKATRPELDLMEKSGENLLVMYLDGENFRSPEEPGSDQVQEGAAK